MATKGSTTKKATEGSAYQKEINSWTPEDLNKKLIECERNLHLDLQNGDKRQEIFKLLAAKWLPASPNRDPNGLPVDIDKEDLERLQVNKRRIIDICGYMLARAELLEISKTETQDINLNPMTFERRIKRFKECYKAVVNKFIENDDNKVLMLPLKEFNEIDKKFSSVYNYPLEK